MSIEQVIANHRKFRTFGQPPVAAFCLSCLSRTRFGKLDSGIVGFLEWATKYCGLGRIFKNLRKYALGKDKPEDRRARC